MKNKLFIKSKFENCIYFVFAVFLFVVGLYFGITNKNIEGFSLIIPELFGWPLFALSILFMGFEVYYLVTKNESLYKIKKILYLVLIVLGTLVLFDLVVLGIVRSFVVAISLDKRPTSDYPLMVRLAYICINRYSDILNGVFTTLWLSLLGTLIGLLLGLLFVVLRTLEVTPRDNEITAFFKKIGRGFVQIYVTVFRGTPMMVQAIIIYYFLPGILSGIFGVDQKVFNELLSVGVAGLVTVSLNTTAYLTEVLRGGIESLNKGQTEAARSLGMTVPQTMIHVILPQGIKNSLPAICNEFIINIKDTSVLSVISVMDLFFVINSINGKNANQDAIFIAAIIYLCLTLGISKLLSVVEKKMNLVSKPLPSSN